MHPQWANEEVAARARIERLCSELEQARAALRAAWFRQLHPREAGLLAMVSGCDL